MRVRCFNAFEVFDAPLDAGPFFLCNALDLVALDVIVELQQHPVISR